MYPQRDSNSYFTVRSRAFYPIELCGQLYLEPESNRHSLRELQLKCNVTTNSTTEAYLGDWWVSIPLPPESQSGTLPIELQTPYNPTPLSEEVDFRHRHCKNKSPAIAHTLCASQYRMLGSNQPKAGYEPTSSTQDLRYIAESSEHDPHTFQYHSLSRR